MNTVPGELAGIAVCFMALMGLAFAVLSNTQRIRALETRTDGHVTKPVLDAFASDLLGQIDTRFDAMEVKQAKREDDRMAYLLKNAEQLGGVRSTNELLTGQLATLAAKLDRQIEVVRIAQTAIAKTALDVPVPYTS